MKLHPENQFYSPTENQTEKFQDFFNIHEKPWKIENDFYQKLYKYIKYISWIPWLRMIGIWNSISMNCATVNSDIDLYIVTAPNRMWLVRILITLIFQILWVRKTPKHHAGRFCLSFFSTTDALDFWKFKISNDIYLYFWILYFKPVLDINNTYSHFLQKNKLWANFSKYPEKIQENKKYIKYSKNKSERNIFSILWDILDNLFKKIFLPKTLWHYEKIWKPYGIIITNDMLKFHNWDVRKEISDKIKKQKLI
jgi:hypothetical protein